MKRYNVINKLIKHYAYKSYLEIGVFDGKCFDAIRCNNKIGVDPDNSSRATIFKTSDEFFCYNKDKFDIIFLDGLHLCEQTYKDIINALNSLSVNGSIVVHDCNPILKSRQIVPRPYESGKWNGDVWKAWIKFRQNRNDLRMLVVDVDHGCGFIQRGKQQLLNIDVELTFENFEKNRKEWLNLISWREFVNEFIKGR